MPSPVIIKNRYEIKTVLGRGGMGVVYQAYDSLMKRDVAVKTLREVPDGTLVELFYRECTVLAGMVHPNVIEIFDMGEFEDGDSIPKPFFVMPLLPGQTLHDLLYPSSNPLPASRCVDIVSQACRGLQAAHDRDMLHRDIKPRNIFVMKDDAVKLIDFGVAHLMGSNSTGMRGTPQYMSPEQITFKPLDRQSDIFSMATVCYEALTAVHPFLRNPDGRDAGSDIAAAITGYTPPLASDLNPSVNRAVAQVVAKGMAKDPWNRFGSAAIFADALQKALRNEGTAKPNTAGVQIRIERARRSLEQKDFQFASEIIGELEAEGHSDPDIRRIRGDLDSAVKREKTDRLIEAATRYFASEELTLALRKVQEVLQIEPANPSAIELKRKIEDVLTEQRVSDFLKTAAECIERAAFTGARQAIQDALKLRPHDARARQLLTEVDSRQKEILRQRQDQERLFQAAHAAWLGGKIKLAIANLEELTELTRRAHDPGERSNEYHEFYRRIRAEQEAVESALDQARDLLANGDFSGVQRICERYLRKYPEHEQFMSLTAEVAKRREEEAKAYRASIVSRLAAEPNLNAKAEILEEALNNHPKDEYFERELAAVREKQQEVKAVVSRARGLEKQQAFAPALNEWESLLKLYPQYPGLQDQITKTRTAWQKQRAQAQGLWAKRISGALDGGDHAAALQFLSEAEREFPQDAELTELLARAEAQKQRFEAVSCLLEKGLAAARLQQLEKAERALSEAAQLSRGAASLLRSTAAAFVQAAGAMDANWRTAKVFLEKARQIDNGVAAPAALRQRLEEQEKEESVKAVLGAAADEQKAGRFAEAQARVETALKAHPNERRLLDVLLSIEAAIAENRRREEREAALESLKRLRDELPEKETVAELQASLQWAKATAELYPSEAKISSLATDIVSQGAAFEQATDALARDDAGGCIAECEEMLARVPGYRLFLNLKVEAALREAQKAAAFLDKVERQLTAEPDLGRRAQLLEDAVRQYPEEPYYQEELRLVKGKQDLVHAIVQQAQVLEANGWYAEAMDRWHYGKTIHPALPEFEESVARCARLLSEKRARSRQQSLASMQAALDKRDYLAALQEFARAQTEFPDDADVRELGRLARDGREKRLRCEKLLQDGIDQLEAGRFREGQATLATALEEGANDPSAAKRAATSLIDYAREAMASDPARAEAMISDACAIDPHAQVPPDLRSAIGDAKRRREFEECSRLAATLEAKGDVAGASEIIAEFLRRSPGHEQAKSLHARLAEVQEEIRWRAQRAKELEELSALEDQAQTLVQRSGLLELLDQTEQIARRNPRDEDVTVAASHLRVLLSTLAEIRLSLSEDRFAEAAKLCIESRERFPLFKPFADLQAEIQERQRQTAEEYRREVEQRLAYEPDFRHHRAILNEALETYPDESFYASELQLARNKEALLEGEMARARELEESDCYEDALREWKSLRASYPWFTELDAEISRVVQLLEENKKKIANAWIRRVEEALEADQYESASQILQEALADLPEEPNLLALERQLEQKRQKLAAAQDSFTRGQSLLDVGDRNGALTSFEHALRITPQDSKLRRSIASMLLEKASMLVHQQWNEAEKLVAKALEIQPGLAIPDELRDEIRRQKTAFELARVLQQIDQESAQGNWTAALQLLDRARPLFPEERAIDERLQAVTAAIRQLEAERARAAAFRSVADLRAQLERLGAKSKRRPLVRLKASIEASPLLVSDDPEIQSSTQKLLSDVEWRLKALETKRAEPEERRDRAQATSWQTVSRSPLVLAVVGVGCVAAIVAFWILGDHGLRAISFAVTPDQVSITVDGKSCVTPDCKLTLRPGKYNVRLAKRGYVDQSFSLEVDAGAGAPVRVAATLLPVPAAGQNSEQPDTGTLNVTTNVSDADLIIGGKRYSGTGSQGVFRLTLPAKTYGVSAERSGYLASETVPVTVVRSSETALKLRLRPLPAVLELRGVTPGTTVKVDGVPTGKTTDGKQQRLEISAGNHTFAFSREGFKAKIFQRKVEPGERVVISGLDLQLPPAADPEALEWSKAIASGRSGELQNFVRKYPNGAHSADAARLIQETEWDSVDKKSIPALRAYLSSHPQSPHAAQARQFITPLEEEEKLGAELRDWNGVEKDSRKSVEGFLAKHPNGTHAAAAARMLADLNRKEEAAQLDGLESNAWNAVNAKDRRSLEGFIKLYPAGKHRPEADRALAALNVQTVLPLPDDSPAVLAAVQRLATAWNTKDMQAILAAQPSLTLNKRAIRAQLEASQSIHVTINPVSNPQISGDHATVACLRKVEQVFSDGTQKSLELPVTFALKKNGGNWVIEGSK